MRRQIENEMKDYFEGKLSVLSADIDLNKLQSVSEKVKAI